LKKVRSSSKKKIDEISALIGTSFRDYPYEQGFMRKLMEFAYKVAEKNGCPCILDTDAKGKCDRYVHLGMKLVQTRTAAGCKIYDLMYSKDGVN
jgi:hypothetical protein